MARMTRASSEVDPRLVSPTKVGEDPSESLFKPCRRKEPLSMSRSCSDGRNNDRTSRSQCTIGSKVVIQFAARKDEKWVAQYCVGVDVKLRAFGCHVTRTHTGWKRAPRGVRLPYVFRSRDKAEAEQSCVDFWLVVADMIYYPSCRVKYDYAINTEKNKLGKVYSAMTWELESALHFPRMS